MASSATSKDANIYSETSKGKNRQQSTKASLADVPPRSQRSTKRENAFISSDARKTRIRATEDAPVDYIQNQGNQDICQVFEFGWRSRDLLSGSSKGREDESHKNLKDRPESGEKDVTPDSSQDSDPVRHAKRRRKNEINKRQLSSCDLRLIQPPNKRTRTLRTTRALADSIPQDRSISLRQEGESENYSGDYIALPTNLLSRVVVEVPIFDDFDRDAYAKVSASSSQLTEVVNTQGGEERLPQRDSPPVAPIKKDIIPDSQDSLGSWNYEPSPLGTSGNPPKLINPQHSSPAASEIPDLEVVSSPSQTSSVAPSAQPDYIDYYSVDSQISSRSAKSVAQADSICNQVGLGQRTAFGAEESQDLSGLSEVPLVVNNSIFSDDALENLLRESPQNLHSHDSRGVLISSSGYEAVSFEEQGSLGHKRSGSPPKAVSDEKSSEPWQGAQIVPNFDFSVSQKSLGNLDFDTSRDGSTNSRNQRGASLKERSQGSSNRSGLNRQGTNTQQSVPLRNTVASERPQRATRRDGSVITSSPDARNRRSENPQRDTPGETPYLHLEKSSSQILDSVIHLGTQNDPPAPKARTPSTTDMADHETASSGSQIDYAALVMAARDKARVKYDQSSGLRDLENTQGPLTAGAPSQMLPVRETSNLIPTSIAPMDEISDEDESQSSFSNGTRHITASTSMERIVFLPLPSMVRDIYFTELKRQKNQIRSFLSNDDADQNILGQMNAMIEKLNMIADHQDLPYEESSTQQSLTDDQVVKWATTCSPKCLFLQHLLRRLRIHARDIVIVARPGRMLDILELILKGDRQIYNRLDRPGQLAVKNIGGLTVTLIPSGMNGGQDLINRADAVIAFDGTSRMTARFSNVAERSDRGLPSPVISLVVAFSPDHIDLCLPQDMDPVERTLSLIDFIVRTREGLGQLSAEFPSPEEAATAVAGYMPSSIDEDAAWPLKLNLAIPGLGFPICHQIEKPLNIATHPQGPYVSEQSPPHSAMKRTLRTESIGEANADGSKRMRMTPAPGDLASSGDIKRISDSVDGTRLKPSSAEAANDSIVKVKELDEEQSKQIVSLLDKVDDLEKQLQSKQSRVKDLETIIEQLSQKVKDLETRILDLTRTIQNVQPKYRQAIAARGRAEAERDAAQSQVTKLNGLNNMRGEEIAKLKVEKTNLEAELTVARAALTTSSVPEAAKLAQAQDQIRELLAEKERLEKRVASVQGDFDFTRDAYQKASSYVTELNNEVSQLKEENMKLNRQASDNRVRIAEIQHASEARQREERIEELEALLKDRERELAKKSEELKIKTNGRRETRGTSVPRSPRLGSGAMSPRPQFARTTGGSRGASPAPGEAREGFRDPPLFPPSGLGSARYSHLA